MRSALAGDPEVSTSRTRGSAGPTEHRSNTIDRKFWTLANARGRARRAPRPARRRPTCKCRGQLKTGQLRLGPHAVVKGLQILLHVHDTRFAPSRVNASTRNRPPGRPRCGHPRAGARQQLANYGPMHPPRSADCVSCLRLGLGGEPASAQRGSGGRRLSS